MIKYKKEDLGTEADFIAKLVFTAMRRTVPGEVREELKSRGLFPDLIQEGYIITCEIKAQNLDGREIFRYASRGFYRFLKDFGFSRPKKAKTYITREELKV